MVTDQSCSGCAQKHDCKSLYGALGNAEGPGVVRKVIFVFLFPLAVFIASIAGLDFFFKEWIASESIRTAAAFGLAALIAIASAGLVRWIVPAWGRPCQTDQDRNLQNGNTREKDI
jgi:hypothetical protein